MESFDNERIRHLFEAFKKTDEFYDSFRDEFFQVVTGEIKHSRSDLVPDSELHLILRSYADKLLSATESVLEKDSHYPSFRLKEELEYMNRLIAKQSGSFSEFDQKIHQKVKELIVHFYPQLPDLSGDGLRLLEKNTRVCTQDFSVNYNHYLQSVQPNSSR